MKLYSRLCFLILLSGGCAFIALTVKKDTDYKNIEFCLRELFSADLGYTLIGCKPISFESCRSSKYDSRTRQALFEFLKAVFHKSEKYIIKIDSFDSYSCFPQIMLVHKKALLKTVAKEPLLQNFIQRKFQTNEAFFKALADPKIDLFTCLSGDEILLGIVLGYGRSNSVFYKLRCDVGRCLKKFPFVCLLPFNPKPTLRHILPFSLPAHLPYCVPVPQYDTTRFSSLEQCWEWIEDREVAPNLSQPPVLFEIPGFVVCKGMKSLKITKKFSTARDKLASLFSQRTYREVLENHVLEVS
jgi:hypothetical protein